MLGCFAYDVSPDVGCYETWGAEGCGAAVRSEKSDQLLFSNQTTKRKIIHLQAVLGKIWSFVSFSEAFSTSVSSLKVRKRSISPLIRCYIRPNQNGCFVDVLFLHCAGGETTRNTCHRRWGFKSWSGAHPSGQLSPSVNGFSPQSLMLRGRKAMITQGI